MQPTTTTILLINSPHLNWKRLQALLDKQRRLQVSGMYSALRNGLMPTFDDALPSVQHPLAEQVEARTTEHLTLERLELVHKPLGLPLAPVERQPGVYRRAVAPYP